MKKFLFVFVCALFSSFMLNAQENIALGKTAIQSSDFGGLAQNAVDGNTDGDYSGSSITHTNNDPGAWWQVDLGSVYDINGVKLYNRTDCCAERLNNFTILVSETPFTDNTGGTAFVTNEPYIDQAIRSFRGNAKGRYVRVFLKDTGYLSLAEVEVYASPPAVAILPVNPPNGTISFYNSGAWQILEPGTDGSVLTLVNGLPAWAGSTEGNFNIILNDAGAQKLNVVKEVNNLLGIGLVEAKNLVDSAPCTIKENISQEEAERLKTALESVGAKVSISQ